MISLRELMRDRRVAAGLGGLAVLLVGYRIYTTAAGKPAAVPPDFVQEVSAPSQGGIAGAEGGAAGSPKESESTAGTPVRHGGETAWSWGRNPFVPTWRETHPASGAAIRPVAAGGEGFAGQDQIPGLRGTVVSGQTGIAIFGRKLVPVGGRIGEWTVERVDPYAVTLRNAREVRVFELFKPPPAGVRGKGGER